MDATVSAIIKEIASSLESLSALRENFPLNLSEEFFGAVFAAVGAIIVALTIDKIKKGIEKPLLIPGKILKTLQGATYHFRLPLKNDSEYIAKRVEVNIDKIVDPNDREREIVPTPFDWTHGNEIRDIFPHQTALLNICEVQQEQGKFIRLSIPRIMHLDSMTLLTQGTTKLALKYYMENGQTGEIKLKVVWNGNESFNEEDLPKIKLV